jgi:hypothetical protein
MEAPVTTISGVVGGLVIGAKTFPTVGRAIAAVASAVEAGAVVAVACVVGWMVGTVVGAMVGGTAVAEGIAIAWIGVSVAALPPPQATARASTAIRVAPGSRRRRVSEWQCRLPHMGSSRS